LYIVSIGIIALVGYVVFIMLRKPTPPTMPRSGTTSTKPIAKIHHTYSLDRVDAATYKANVTSEIKFTIRNEKNAVLKDYNTTDQPLRVIIVRKDRTNFQVNTPNYNKVSGLFTMNDLTFPTDGQYRLYADFIASDAPLGTVGEPLTSTPYVDLVVGTTSPTIQQMGSDSVVSNLKGLSTELTMLTGDNPGLPVPHAGSPQALAVNVSRGGVPSTDLQPVLGKLGYLVAFGPNLELVQSSYAYDARVKQTGLLDFSTTFPVPGQYKVYLLLRSKEHVETFDYKYTVQPDPNSGR
jgi:hypothetical protein